jgi:hypothetical protein
MPSHRPEAIIQLEAAHTAIDFTRTPPTAASHRTWTIRIDPPNGKAAGELVIGNAGKDGSQASRDAVSKNAEVFKLVDLKVATQGHIKWAAKAEAPAITVLVPRLTRVSTHPGL